VNADRATSRDATTAQGGRGGDGSPMSLSAGGPNGTVRILSSANVEAGTGGSGGDAVAEVGKACPGTSATASGGDGGKGGTVTVTAPVIQVTGGLLIGVGGRGGDAIVSPGDGGSPGCDGGNGTAIGG